MVKDVVVTIYLSTIDFASVTDIKGVDDEQEDDSFKDCFQSVAEYKSCND